MSSELFLFKELIRSLGGRAWITSLVAVIAIALFLGVLVLFSLGMPSQRTEAWVIAVPQKDASQEEIDRLYQQLVGDPEIAWVRYSFAPPAKSNAHGRFEILARSEVDLAGVIERLRSWGEFQEVGPAASGFLAILRAWSGDPQTRWLIWTALFVLFATALLAVYGGLLVARQSFSRELELLELSGVASQTVRLPFILLGVLYGLCGALLVELLLYGGQALLFPLPELPQAGAREQLGGVRAFLLGLIFAGLGGLLGWLSVHSSVHRYPSPLSRSRRSSSSETVSGR